MTRLVVEDPALEEAVRDLAELIRPWTVATIGPYLVAVTKHVGMEAQS